MVIVYKSNTGFTKEYAEMLSKAEKMKLYELDIAQGELARETEVLYMGPVMAGHIQGIDQAVKNFTVKAACGVGMSVPGEQAMAALKRANYVADAPIFYLQGGYAPKKVGWLKRRMVNIATKADRVALQDKGSRRTPGEQARLDMYLKGGSFVEYRNLDTIRKWLSEQG